MSSAAASADRRSREGQLADELSSFLRLTSALKAAVAREGGGVQDRSAAFLLFPLLFGGPQRASALAEAAHADPSTVSRQTAELVRHGLVCRQADPTDRRASLLAVTAEGRRVCEQLRQSRRDLIAAALSGWTDEDVATLAGLMHRLNTDVEAAHRSRGPAALPRLVPHRTLTNGEPE